MFQNIHGFEYLFFQSLFLYFAHNLKKYYANYTTMFWIFYTNTTDQHEKNHTENI